MTVSHRISPVGFTRRLYAGFLHMSDEIQFPQFAESLCVNTSCMSLPCFLSLLGPGIALLPLLTADLYAIGRTPLSRMKNPFSYPNP